MLLYRVCLRLLPPAFRERFGSELEAEAAATLAEARGTWGRVRAAARLARDLCGALLREWGDAFIYETRMGWGGGMGTDLRWATRALRRSPGFALTVVVTLALGIGASTVSLGLVDAYLFRALPYPDAQRLLSVWSEINWSRLMADEAQSTFPSLEAVAAAGGASLVLQEGGDPQELFASYNTTNLFEVMGVRPVLGRDFVPTDAVPGAEAVTILSHRVWAETFGSDPDIIGRAIALGGEGEQTRTVVGVMPADYLPLHGAGVAAWIPVVVDPSDSDYSDSYFMQGVGRLKPGATPDQTRREAETFGERLREREPGWFTDDRLRRGTVQPLALVRTGDRRTPVVAALAAALLVLLVACVNVANLVVARTLGRERELAVRAALGASRLRTAHAVLLELALLVSAGAVGGLAVAWGLVRVLERRFPQALPEWGLTLDARWLGAAVAFAVVAALVAGLLPGFQAARRDPARAMAGGRGGAGRRGASLVQEALSATQVALATAAVAAMVLLGRSVLHLADVDTGFRTPDAITFRVTAPPAAFPDDESVVQFFRQARAALAEVPGVEQAGFVSRLPLAGGDSRISVTPEGWDFSDGTPEPVAWHRLVTPGYLEALDARLLEGRIPDVNDDRDDLPAEVVINRTAARTFWPGESAVGKRFYGSGQQVWTTVAGVVDDILENGQNAPVLPGLYIPHRDWPWPSMYAVVRGRAGTTPALAELKSAVHSVSTVAPISRVQTLGQVKDRGLRSTRTLTVLAAVAGAVALLLGALGIYGVVGHAVARRLREIGVRAALGADRRQILMGELRHATRIVAWGVPLGLVGAWGIGHGLRSVLFGVGSLDVPSFSIAVVLLTGVAYLAALAPARRAARVDPVRVMREE